MKWEIALSTLLVIGCTKHDNAAASNWPTPQRVEYAFRIGAGDAQVQDALAGLIASAARILRDMNRPNTAAQVENEWADRREGFFKSGLLEDVGDHTALSEYLTALYVLLEIEMGDAKLHSLHLDDLMTFNYGIPVVFHPQSGYKWCLDTIASNPDDTCRAEYSRHFAGTAWRIFPDPNAKFVHDGLFPAVVYWVGFGACEAFTSGGTWTYICSPAAAISEEFAERFIAPFLSNDLYDAANN